MKSSFEKKSLAFVIIVLFFGMSIIPSMVAERLVLIETIYVDDDNIEGPWDGTQEHPYQFIQDAIDNATDGDIVFVYSGTYQPSSSIRVNKSITIMGEERSTTIIKPTKIMYFSIISDHVLLCNFTFVNLMVSTGGLYENITVKDNYLIVTDSHLSYSGQTIGLKGVNNKVSNNIITCSNVSFKYFWDGIGLIGAERCTVSNNTITFSNFSVGYTCHGITLGNAYRCRVVGNSISGATYGMNILDNEYIYLEKSLVGQNTIERNTLSENEYGIHLHPCLIRKYWSKITYNNFINNDVSAIFYIYIPSLESIIDMLLSDDDDQVNFNVACTLPKQINLFNKVWYGNYWDDHSGIGPEIIRGKLHSGGIVEIFPGISIPWINIDLHPAKEPNMI